MTSEPPRDHAVWQVAHGQAISLDRPLLMAILNVTPDSFSDGGKYKSVGAAYLHALSCIQDGAVLVDVGGESTRPGAERVDPDEQMRRVIPVIEHLAEFGDTIRVSVDTTHASVAKAAIRAGAHIVNDVSAGLEDDMMLTTVAQLGAGLVLMHRLRPPDEDVYSTDYKTAPTYEDDDVVGAVGSFLSERASVAMAAGVERARIMLDPGLGFGKSVADNFALIAGTSRLIKTTGFPILGAASRKSFIGSVTGVEKPSDRVAGSIAASMMQFLQGARVFRVHDVRPHREAFAVIDVTRPIDGD